MKGGTTIATMTTTEIRSLLRVMRGARRSVTGRAM
jgi:hypothetical protein